MVVNVCGSLDGCGEEERSFDEILHLHFPSFAGEINFLYAVPDAIFGAPARSAKRQDWSLNCMLLISKCAGKNCK